MEDVIDLARNRIDRHAFVHDPGTPNTLRGRNNARRVTAAFSRYERPGATIVPEERRGVCGRSA